MSDTGLAIAREEFPVANHTKMTRLDDSLFSKELAPHYMKLAGQLSSSELVPKAYRGKPQDLFICWSLGYQVGLTPEQSMQCISVINGKPCMWGDEMLALCMVHKEFDDIIEEPMIKDGSVVGYTCTVKRIGKSEKVNVFTLDMAKKAGLLAKGGVWIQYTERMLKLRARGYSLRDAFPDALKGIKSREEVEDYIVAEYKVVDDKGLSRPEILKRDFLAKKGITNAEVYDRPPENDQNKEIVKEAEEDKKSSEMGQDREEASEYHTEIKRLIAEKVFTEERLAKALAYYEASSLDELTPESQEHFYHTLQKL